MGYSDSKTDSENSSGPAHYVAEAVQAQCRGARLAVDRPFVCAESLAVRTLQHALHREEAITQDSWVLGLKHDLFWLCQNGGTDIPVLHPLQLRLAQSTLT